METKKPSLRINQWLMFAVVLLLALSVTGCATMSKPEPPVATDITRDIEPPPAELPPMRPLAEVKPQAAIEERMPYESKLFSLNILEAELQEAIMPMAKAAGLNLVFDRDVDLRAPVTANISNLPLKRALELILGSHGYYYVIDGNILRVKAMETRIFHLDYSLVASTGSSDLSGENFSIDSSIEEDDIKVWKILEDMLKPGGTGGGGATATLLSPAGQAQLNKIAGVIVVTDRPENIERVAHYLGELEKALRRQVLIEARLVEVSLDEGHQYGIDWRAVRYQVGRRWGFAIGSDLGGALPPLPGIDPTAIPPVPPLPIPPALPGPDVFTIGTSYVGSGGFAAYDAVIKALETTGTVNVLSAPRVSVLNNQSAVINLTTELPYLQWEVRNVGTAAAPVFEPVPTITFADEGISLGITPQIGADGMTTLLIVPRVSNRREDRPFNFRGDAFLVPVLTVRETSTLVRVPDGGTVVLGGIIEERHRDREQKVPLLSEIPYLGKLFVNQVRTSEKTELVIMVTATIIER